MNLLPQARTKTWYWQGRSCRLCSTRYCCALLEKYLAKTETLEEQTLEGDKKRSKIPVNISETMRYWSVTVV
ncbi:hypothetical protein ACNKHV_02595 [Shigella flexneri]